MADTELLTNGALDVTTEEDQDHTTPKKPTNNDADLDALTAKISELEGEKLHLSTQNSQLKTQVENLTTQVGSMKEEWDQRERAVEAITKRAFDLEGQVVRLEHDLITAMNSAAEAEKEWEEKVKLKEAEVEEKVKALQGRLLEVVKRGEESERALAVLVEKVKEKEEGLVAEQGRRKVVFDRLAFATIGTAAVSGAIMGGIAGYLWCRREN